ncbi:MAG: LacI family DNA-binding transcriptional regulator [Candidatus Bathyarchaeia archaeon]
MSVTIHDIARLIGVSPSTVSRALSGKGRVSETTRERIQKLAKELGYQPNALARALATRSTFAIAVVIHERHLPLDERSFYGVILETIESEVTQHGYHVVFATLRNHTLPRCIQEGRVDGVVFLGTDIQPEFVKQVKEKAQVVLVDYHLPGVVSVVGDNVEGGKIATQHLLEHGHTRIAFVAETLADPSFRERCEGYRYAFKEHGLPIRKSWVIEGGRRPDSDRIAMEKFLKLSRLPTAIFAANDFMAVGAMHALTQAGFKVPEDVAIVGFDDGALATVVQPPLTTVRVPRMEMGRVAAKNLLDLLRGVNVPMLSLLPTTLTIRASCGC